MTEEIDNILSEEDQLEQIPTAGITEDSYPWYAMKLYTIRQKAIADYFEQKGLEVFVPLEYADVEDKEHKVRHILRPVVRNLLFVKKSLEESEFKTLVRECPYKVSVVTRSVSDRNYAEIPAHQMFEFRVMCNPDLAMTKYISEQEAKLKKGARVRVTHGPLKGLTGRLVRSSKKYYLLKEVPGMGVMLKVSRWCCKAAEE